MQIISKKLIIFAIDMNLTDIIFFKNNNGLTNPLRFSELLPPQIQ